MTASPSHSNGIEPFVLKLSTVDKNQVVQQRISEPVDIEKIANNTSWWQNNKNKVTASWTNQFYFTEEIINTDGTICQQGLRTPQRGAIYASLSHWTTSDDPGIAVMPTGTGKTETMLSLLIKERIDRLLIIVPSDNLRQQIGDKFISLGKLKECGIISDSVQCPVVGRIYHRISSTEQVDYLWNRCHVVVTTMDSLNACTEAVRQYMADSVSHVFVDEAHHSTAPTWRNFLSRCQKNRIMLFTATPFREDGKRLAGKLIYTYPLALAQKERYFRHIDLYPIRQFDPEFADRDIAAKAVEVLEKDLAAGLNHIIMARVSSIGRAETVLTAYSPYTTYKPVIIHSELTKSEQEERLLALKSCESRIAVCVNMLGEGFDLPELKIAAIHDGHQSWTVFLQFIGRFIRNRADLGDASVIINEASQKVSASMKALYKPDSDWNSIIRLQSHTKIQREVKAKECHDGFTDIPFSFTLDQLFPKTSVVVFQLPVGSTWEPKNCVQGFHDEVEVKYCINAENDLLLICAKHITVPDWTESNSIQDVSHDLFAIYYDEANRLMFLHSSNTDTYHLDVAKAIGGKDIIVIGDDQVFRCFDDIYELKLYNVGLSEAMGTQIRYTMHIGSNVKEGLTEVLTTNKSKANLFGTGIKDGKSFSVGSSYKGRIWSRFKYDLTEFKEWCEWVKSKILDETIDTQKIIKNVWMPDVITSLPTDYQPTYVDWPEDFYRTLSGQKNMFSVSDVSYDWCFASILLSDFASNEIRFTILIDNYRSVYAMTIKDGNAIYSLKEGPEIYIRRSKKLVILTEYFQINPVLIRYADLSTVLNKVRYSPPATTNTPQFDIAKIKVWDWAGTDITKESQKASKRVNSIQYRVISELKRDPEYCIIFDDDDHGEAADVIAIKERANHLDVEFYHLKFSTEKTPGSRIEDFYAVCGQAQRSGIWQNPKMDLINHLLTRETKRKRNPPVTRFEKGDMSTLFHLKNVQRSKPFHFSVFAVQPGLSKSKVKADQLIVLGTTETYLMQAYKISFRLIASA